MIVGLVNILGFQWLRSSLIRFYNEKEDNPHLIDTILKSHLIMFLLLIPILTIVGFILNLNNINPNYLIIIYIMIIVLSLYELGIIYYRAKLQPQIIMKNNVFKTLLFVIISTLLLYFGFGTWALLIGNVLSVVVGITLYLKGLNFKKIKFKIESKTLKKMIVYGLPITLSFALSIALENVDKIMISVILGVEENGNYAVSSDLVKHSLNMVLTSFALAGFPLVLKKINEKGKNKGKEEFKKYGELFFLIGLPSTLGLIAVGPNLVNIIIGEEYTISNHLLTLIIISTFINGIKSQYFDLGLQISAKTKYFFYPALIAIIVNVILNYYFLKTYGIEGAAFSTVIAFLLALIISGIYSKKNYKVKLSYITLVKIVATTTIMYLVIDQINYDIEIVNLILKISIGIFVYVLFTIIFNTLKIRTNILKKIRGKK